MNRKDVRDAADTYTGKLSEVVRQLSFAGIAVIWIFKTGEKTGGIAYSNDLLLPLGCFVLSLGFDFLQYLYGSIAWSVFHTYKQRSGIDNSTDFKAPGWINYAAYLFFSSKAIMLFIGYVFLLTYIGNQLLKM